MLVQSNYVDSPIQDCAHVSQVWSMLLFYNPRSLTYQIPVPLFYALCTKGMSQGFGEMKLSFINKANFLFSLTVMFLEYCTYKFHGKAFKLTLILFSKITSKIAFLLCKLELSHDFEMQPEK